MATEGPARILVDADGNVLSVEDGATIGSAEALLVAGKDGTVARYVRVASDGTVRVDPTGTTVQPVSAGSLPLPAGAATEATLATLLTQATGAAIQAALEAIKNTDGVKKIVDPLPAGTSVVGKVRLVDRVDHEYTALHMGGVESNQTVTGTHALFTHDQESQKFLKLMVNSLKRIEIMLEHATEVEVGAEEDEDD